MTNEEELMEKKLKSLFDFQKFEGNSELAAMIADTEARYKKQLDEADLLMVNAAGSPEMSRSKEDKDKENK